MPTEELAFGTARATDAFSLNTLAQPAPTSSASCAVRSWPLVETRAAAVLPDNRLQDWAAWEYLFLPKLSHFEVAGGRLVLKQ